jgi:quercetin dioxygenase-like cupin family protein
MAIPQLVVPNPIAPQRILRVSARDAATLLAHLPAGAVQRELPGSPEHAYLDRYIVKPWGHELRVYDDRLIDVWRLSIEAGMGTSLHGHPRKETGLICIGGSGVLETGSGELIPLEEGSVVHVGAGALHRTSTTDGISLLEVELPRDKFDLVRIDDGYGRAGTSYEGEEASQREPCPLVGQPAGPPEARLRRHCATGCFRFNLEIGAQAWQMPHDIVAVISLDTSTVLSRELTVLGVDGLAAIDRRGLYLTVRSNHR